ncbi:alpha/beta hydrolase [Micromonospora ureilytica]|uniref:alpha/beta hydrolase n=1 Tax=Micromonospora ureilytica TaxID=709868 RepID=UPI0040393826
MSASRWSHLASVGRPADRRTRRTAAGPSGCLGRQQLRGTVVLAGRAERRGAATPLVGGHIYRKEFAQRSRLVTVDDNPHGVYVHVGNACALIVGTVWLVDGELFKDTDCPAS